MPVTPDSAAGPSLEEELILDDLTVEGNPTVEGAIRRVNDDVVAFLGGNVKSLTQGDDADSLFNSLNETHQVVITRTLGIPTAILAHAVGNPALKIREVDQITYTLGRVSGYRVRHFAADGSTVVETLTFAGSDFSTGVVTKT